MTYKDISFCMRSKERFCKENGNLAVCHNKRCFRHSSKIPDNLPEWELICWADMSHSCKYYKRMNHE